VRRTEHGWIVEINPATVPRVRVNNAYANLISRSPDHAMLRTQLQEARWLMRSLEIRNETLIKVARCIVQRQTSFFELGEEAMEPAHPQGRRRSGGNARIHDFTGDHRQIHCTRRAACSSSGTSFPAMSRAADGTEMSSTAIRAKIKKLIRRRIRKIRGATASSRKFCRRRAYRWPGAPLPNIAKACKSRRPTNGSERLPARRK